MGLFQHKQHTKKTADGDMDDAEKHFFDEYFREELRNHGRWYFERIIKENATLFKQDLDATVVAVSNELKDRTLKQLDETIAEVNTHLKEHVAKRLDEHFQAYGQTIEHAQGLALEALNRSAEALETQHKQLSETLHASIKQQEEALSQASQENIARMTDMKEAEERALQSITKSAEALEEHYQTLTTTLKKNVADQEASLVRAFEDNMAHVVEQYILEALENQYDLSAQLPSIIKQLEDNKQTMVDDIRL